MAHKRHLLLVAALDLERKRSLSVMAGAADLELTHFASLPAALSWVETNDPRVVVFDTGMPKSEKLCERVRSRRTLASVPLIGLAPALNDALTGKLFAMGADDVIPALSSAALMTRLRLVPAESLPPPPDRGLAVIADAERARCDVFGRVLLNAGYDVKHAYDESALRFYANKADVRVIVANAEIGSPRALIEEGRKLGSNAVWIVTAQRRDLAARSEILEGVPRTCVLGIYSPPENLLFASNELIGGSDHSRESPRMLYGAVVAFRAAGETSDEFGFCYNVSRGGLYVRTLAPPEHDAVWLELRPPRTKQCVRLEGRVAWRRAFGPTALATAPPGFGVELIDWLGQSLALWQAGYSSLAEVPGDSAPSLRAAAPARETTAAKPPPPPSRPRNPADFAPPPIRLSRTSSISAAAVLIAEIEEGEAGEASSTAPASDQPASAPEPSPSGAEHGAASETPADTAGPGVAATGAVEPQQPAEAAAFESVSSKAGAPSDSLPLGTVTSRPLVVRRRSVRRNGLLTVAALLAGAVGVLSWAALRGTGSGEKAHDGSMAAPQPQAPSPVVSAPAAPAPAPKPVAPISARNEPAPAPSAAPPETARTVEAANGDGTELPHNQGYLEVRSSVDADVYATGFKVGKTNTRNRTRCQLRWIRLGTGDPPRWISPGVTTMVKCRDVTQISLEPGDPDPERRGSER